MICVLGGALGAAIGSRAGGMAWGRERPAASSETVARLQVRDGAVLIGNPYTCSLSAHHLALLDKATGDLSIDARFFIPLAEGEEADYEQIAADFITGIVPERLGWEDVKSLIGSMTPRFPALVVVRGGRVAARFEYPLSLKVLSSLPAMFGIDHGALTAITVAATPPPISPENLP